MIAVVKDISAAFSGTPIGIDVPKAAFLTIDALFGTPFVYIAFDSNAPSVNLANSAQTLGTSVGYLGVVARDKYSRVYPGETIEIPKDARQAYILPAYALSENILGIIITPPVMLPTATAELIFSDETMVRAPRDGITFAASVNNPETTERDDLFAFTESTLWRLEGLYNLAGETTHTQSAGIKVYTPKGNVLASASKSCGAGGSLIGRIVVTPDPFTPGANDIYIQARPEYFQVYRSGDSTVAGNSNFVRLWGR